MAIKWTNAMDTMLSAMRADGISMTKIADRISKTFNCSITKNAVIGRANRLNLKSLKPSGRSAQPSGRNAQSARKSDTFLLDQLNASSSTWTDRTRKQLQQIFLDDLKYSNEAPIDVAAAYPNALTKPPKSHRRPHRPNWTLSDVRTDTHPATN